MPLSLAALLGFVAWTVLLALSLVTWRTAEFLRGVKRVDEFPAGVPHGTDRYWRLNRAHLNCVENLPIFGGAVLVAWATEAPVDGLAMAYLAARIGQSVTHIASGAPVAIMVRATCFVAQLGIVAAMVGVMARG